MKYLLSLAAVASVAACAQQQPSAPSVSSSAAAALVHITQGGELVEVERTPEHSIVEVRSAPAGSVPSSLFALRGACAVARARGEKYFSSSPVAGRSSTHSISFPQEPTEVQLKGRTKTVFTLADCQLLRF